MRERVFGRGRVCVCVCSSSDAQIRLVPSGRAGPQQAPAAEPTETALDGSADGRLGGPTASGPKRRPRRAFPACRDALLADMGRRRRGHRQQERKPPPSPHNIAPHNTAQDGPSFFGCSACSACSACFACFACFACLLACLLRLPGLCSQSRWEVGESLSINGATAAVVLNGALCTNWTDSLCPVTRCRALDPRRTVHAQQTTHSCRCWVHAGLRRLAEALPRFTQSRPASSTNGPRCPA